MMNFKRWDRLVGWSVFFIAAMTYLLTMEPSTSLWDCAEFIATSYKLQVGHPPGAPLFMLMARIATMFAPSTHYVPHMVNALNCMASAFCILFLYWTITHLARRIFTRGGRAMSQMEKISVLGAGAVGALAYTFTDTFWFSAVEGEVYAISSMFTALVVWLMLKWEEQADEPHSARWIILIAYLMGLSIGVHILNLLTIPALVFIYYFRKYENITLKGMALATLVALAILGFINGIIIPYTVYLGAMVDVFFVNSLGLPVNMGISVFALAVLGALFYGVIRTHRAGRKVWNLILLSTLMILIGFSSYATVTIRAVANPPMNSNNPNNPQALLSVLNRDQYGNRPLLYGAYYSSPIEDYTEKTSYKFNPDTKKYEQVTQLTGYTYPSEFMLVCAMNPCKCGWYGDPSGRCSCSQLAVDQYRSRISGPLLDRIDIIMEVPAVHFEELRSRQEAEPSKAIKERVDEARHRQNLRFGADSGMCNARMGPDEMRKYCQLDDGSAELMKRAFDLFGLTARSYDRILKVARTIADLDGSEYIRDHHVAEAIQYRTVNI